MVIQKPFLDPQKRVDLAVADIARRVKYSGLVTVIDGEQFAGTTDGNGKPQIWYETEAVTVARDYEFGTRNLPMQFDDIFKTKLPITIDQHMTQGVRWTPEQETFDEVRFATDVLPPATSAVANRLNSKIVSAFRGASDIKITDLSLDASGDANGASALRQALALKVRLDGSGMPEQGRILVAGANVFPWLAASDATLKYDTSQAQTLFRRGVFGLIADMQVVPGGDLVDANEFAVVHPSWAVMPTAAGELPDNGVAWARKASVDGFSARLLRGYSLDYDRNASALHLYWKINELKDEISRHTRASAASASDGSVAGDPIITSGALVTTGKNVRIAKGTFTGA